MVVFRLKPVDGCRLGAGWEAAKHLLSVAPTTSLSKNSSFPVSPYTMA